MNPPEHTDRGRSFDAAAELYDRVRPGYPRALYDDLAALAELEVGSRVLEIGSGTGKATVALAGRGYRVIGVEPGSNLAAIARRRLATHPSAEVDVARFEDWPLPPEPFDAVVSATAFHWIDPEVRVTKAAEALRPGGSLAIIETHRLPQADDEILARLWGCFERWDPDARPWRTRPHDEPPEHRGEVERSGLFDRIESRRYDTNMEYSTRENHDLLLTFSNVLVLEPDAREGLLGCIGDLVDGELGGRMRELVVNELLVARKR